MINMEFTIIICISCLKREVNECNASLYQKIEPSPKHCNIIVAFLIYLFLAASYMPRNMSRPYYKIPQTQYGSALAQ